MCSPMMDVEQRRFTGVRPPDDRDEVRLCER
jgi:hypothetical protein